MPAPGFSYNKRQKEKKERPPAGETGGSEGMDFTQLVRVVRGVKLRAHATIEGIRASPR